MRSKFQAGQEWKFNAPEGQPGARLIILKVENGGKLGTLVHVAVTGMLLPNGGTSAGHLPFTEGAVVQSVTSLEKESVPLPDYQGGYSLWRKAFDEGKAGAFTIPAKDAIEAVFASMK